MGHDRDADEVFTSVGTLLKRLELAEAVADMLVEEYAHACNEIGPSDSLEEALVAWETVRGKRFIYTDGTEHVITTGRGGLRKWLDEQGYEADQANWELVPPDGKISIWCSADGSIAEVDDPMLSTVEHTATEWLEKVKENGLLCREEF